MSASSFRILVSDVDGTLVTHDKVLTDATVAAIHRLEAAGIGFTVVSSRPPFGMSHVLAQLGPKLPYGAYNGGAVMAPDGAVLEQTFIPEAAAREAAAYLREAGIGVWVFADGQWLVTDPAGDYVERERHTIGTGPVVVPAFGDALARAGKIVGASRDFAHLAACEAALHARLHDTAEVARSQQYYLDVTPAGLSKGTFLEALSRRTGVPIAEMAAIGDMDNDVAMLRIAGLSIAMGNASEAARAAASRTTASNEEDGVAWAIDNIILAGR